MRMMLGVLAVAALALVAGTAAGQDTGLVGKGFKVGLAMSEFSGDHPELDEVDPDLKTGLAAGGFLTFALGANLALQPEVLYVMKGSVYEEGGYKYTFKFNYLDAPILFKYRFPTEGKTRPNLFAGPVPSFNLSARLHDEAPSGDREDDFEHVKGFDLGFAFGGGLDFATASSTITFDVRYTLGLTEWYDGEDPDNEVTLKNRGWLVAAGIGF
jgi:hypothetical protein